MRNAPAFHAYFRYNEKDYCSGWAYNSINHNAIVQVACTSYVKRASIHEYNGGCGIWHYGTGQQKGKHFPRAICRHPTVECLPSCRGTMQVTRFCVCASAGCLWVLCGRLAPACTRGSKYAGDGNQFLSVVQLPEDAIVELELGIAKKPMNMC